MKKLSYFLYNRVWRQWLLASIAILVIILGWKYYWIAFTVPLVMVINMLSPLVVKGRFVCGNVCPRGALLDRLLAPFSRKKKIPTFFINKTFRWCILILIFGNFLFQVLHQPFTAQNFGHIFWLICVATTFIAIILGLYFSHRIWCAFCPIGTFISTCCKNNDALIVNENTCLSCHLCEKVCPMNLKIIVNTEDQQTTRQNDCIKCGDCVLTCPKKALQLKY